MKWKISLLIAIVIGALAGSWIKNLPGFVLIAVGKTTYEMRLWIAVCLIIFILSVLLLVGAFVRSLFSGAGKMKDWHGTRHWRISRKKTIQGMLAYTEGRWKVSEDLMVNAAKSSDTKLINYLIAAQAAQQQNAAVRRDSYLRLAHQAEPSATIAIGLTQAQLQLKQGQFEQALASLNELKNQSPNHPYVLKLLCHLFEKLQDWQQLLSLLPSLKKHQVFDAEELKNIESASIAGLLQRHATKDDIEAIQDCWLKLTAAQRKSKANIMHYCTLLVEFECMQEADQLLKPIVKKQADAEVLALYGNIITDNPTKQLSFLENWQQTTQIESREVFLTLGKMAYHAELWGKARQFLQQVIEHKPSAQAYLMMAKTLRNLNETESAIHYYQQGLEFIASPKKRQELIAFPQGSDDLIQANLLPKFQKLE